MINQIKLENNSVLINYKKYGRNRLFYFSGGEIFNSSELRKNKIFIKCAGLGTWFERLYRSSFLHTKWYSSKWHSSNNNTFKGKQHTEETRKKLSNFMKGRYIGELNPFYGKSHSEETKKKILEKSGRSGIENGFYGRSYSIQTRAILSEKSKKYALENIDKMKENGIKSAKILARGRKTNPKKL